MALGHPPLLTMNENAPHWLKPRRASLVLVHFHLRWQRLAREDESARQNGMQALAIKRFGACSQGAMES